MRIAIVGGGPGGLYSARLLKKSRPAARVDVFERGSEGATWGFGVGLGGRTMKEIEEADKQVHDDMIAAMQFHHEQLIHLNGSGFKIDYTVTTGALSRLKLLQILASACRDVGVNLRYETTVESSTDLAEYDLIIAADGANSRLRTEHQDALGTRHRTLTNHFAWYGVGRALTPMALIFRSFEGGTFVGHYYAYTENLSTFVAECDDETWYGAGLDRMTDGQRKAEMERVFAEELNGSPLIDNHSIWRQFPAISNEAFYSENVVLVGDSLRVAHFSIGSGTRLAMEDASALNAAFKACGDDVEAALQRFEDIRRPARDKFAEAARLSFEWYEDMAVHMQQPLMPFVYEFLTRTGRVSDERLRSYAPGFYDAYQHDRQGLRASARMN